MREKVTILGGGESGLGAAMLASKCGLEVFLSDKGGIAPETETALKAAGIDFEQGKHTESKILESDVVIKSPGIPDDAPLIIALRSKGIAVISEIEFAFRHSKGRLIAVTGSNGKTTTSTLIYHLLEGQLPNVDLVGNVGYSYAKSVAQGDKDFYVVEVSSFQLDDAKTFNPHIAVLTNITPDHLERYNYDFELYAASKMKITANQTDADYFIYNADDPVICEHLTKTAMQARLIPFSVEKPLAYGLYVQDGELIVQMGRPYPLPLTELPLQGKHNYKNIMAALAVTEILKLDKSLTISKLKTFKGIEHRLEWVAEVNGVQYINDSKATNVDSVFYALESVRPPLVWIVGGIDKGNDYEPLIPFITDKARAIVCLGTDNSKILKAFAGKVPQIVETNSMAACVKEAFTLAKNGDTVLLSPACASFDLFKNYEDRGRQFKEEVLKLKKQDSI